MDGCKCFNTMSCFLTKGYGKLQLLSKWSTMPYQYQKCAMNIMWVSDNITLNHDIYTTMIDSNSVSVFTEN